MNGGNRPRPLVERKEQYSARRLASVLDRQIFRVDHLACAAAADTIKAYHASVERMPWGALPRSNQLVFKLAFVAICHQFNWDFLQDRLSKQLLAGDQSQMIRRLAAIKSDELQEWLAGYDKPDRIQATARAAMLRDIGKGLLAIGGDALTLVTAASDRIAGSTGFVNQLNRFEPYNLDPLHKKSYVLIQDLIREGIVRFEDEDSLRPAIDYHIMRLYLRSGRVVPLYEVVADALRLQHPRPRLVHLLREAVAEALQATASYAKLSIAEVNYVEWQLGRSICERDIPACLRTERPAGLDIDIGRIFVGNCPYMGFCQAQRDPEWRKLQEPKFVSTFY